MGVLVCECCAEVCGRNTVYIQWPTTSVPIMVTLWPMSADVEASHRRTTPPQAPVHCRHRDSGDSDDDDLPQRKSPKRSTPRLPSIDLDDDEEAGGACTGLSPMIKGIGLSISPCMLRDDNAGYNDVRRTSGGRSM